MLKQKQILVAEDNNWIAAELVQAIADHDGIPLGPAARNVEALALIDEAPDGAILDGNLIDGPITPVALALLDRSLPLVVFTGLGLPADLQRTYPNIRVILKPSPCLAAVHALECMIAGRSADNLR
jgi:CheY-like chemotaxis protein